ncbi:MAG: ORF6N domain-containing protein [Candidatus Saganbacteria bacterium]|nr:ORF6N domain-containing protein [Candidatus Saganbacteria bacterium]
MSNLVPEEKIGSRIYLVRGQRVMLDFALAELYVVTTGNLNKAVKRNIKRFPRDFMFQITKEEYESLRFQFGILKRGQHSKFLPYAFTQEGVAMLSGVLNSDRAIAVNIQIMRVFSGLRQILATHKELAAKLDLLESKVAGNSNQIRQIFGAIRQLMNPPVKKQKKIGFLRD